MRNDDTAVRNIMFSRNNIVCKAANRHPNITIIIDNTLIRNKLITNNIL